jgi:hypothetical protein
VRAPALYLPPIFKGALVEPGEPALAGNLRLIVALAPGAITAMAEDVDKGCALPRLVMLSSIDTDPRLIFP